ncbi:MAG: SDR family NAD(P)-dependent oxidoreductase [Cyanothece sp. SIO1E1]|nr:SDR family NAD(P)-dependent oxidoreductase [Cyanothece sp. SIO1E1]
MDSKKVALVTGASAGIGKATVKQLLNDGMIVYAAARRLEKMEDLARLGAHPLKMDITIEEDIQRVVETITSKHGQVDVLVNNAGYAVYGSVEEVSIDQARRQFEVNIFGLARLTQLLLPGMRENGFGKIVNISSVGGKIYTPLGAWYHGTKHALEGWSDVLRLEVQRFGIDVIIIEPGGIETEFEGVMTDPMKENSGNGPYKVFVDSLIREAGKVQFSKPEVISEVISKAVHARKPKTRYVAGSMAKPLLFIRYWFSDRFFDRLLLSRVK